MNAPKFVTLISRVLLPLLALITVEAHAAILALTSDGKLWSIDTGTAAATEIAQVVSDANSLDSSPNSLGVSGQYVFFTESVSAVGDPDRQMYRFDTLGTAPLGVDDTVSLTNVPVSGFLVNLADGAADGDNFYYVDSGGTFRTVSGITGDPGTQTFSSTTIGSGGTVFGGSLYGDIEIIGDTVFLVYGMNTPNSATNNISTFSLSNPEAGFTATANNVYRFAGLAVDGGTLYGIEGSDNSLWSINTTTLAITKVGDITGLTAGVAITDASRTGVPLPAAAWMFISAISGLIVVGRRRRMLAATA